MKCVCGRRCAHTCVLTAQHLSSSLSLLHLCACARVCVCVCVCACVRVCACVTDSLRILRALTHTSSSMRRETAYVKPVNQERSVQVLIKAGGGNNCSARSTINPELSNTPLSPSRAAVYIPLVWTGPTQHTQTRTHRQQCSLVHCQRLANTDTSAGP